MGPGGTDFGLCADLGAPDGMAWSHLLMEDFQPHTLAALLRQLRVGPEEVEAATDWNGNALVDLAPVRKELEATAKSAKKAAQAVAKPAGSAKTRAAAASRRQHYR